MTSAPKIFELHGPLPRWGLPSGAARGAGPRLQVLTDLADVAGALFNAGLS
ncbi:hypothetical protein ACIBQ2_20710 [Micromonospora sediminimaris]|uniref:hypothetical protein n=1 Tax=Micromonospora sediminimaris TaxID=547162 RepID=UPI003787F035